MLNEAIGMARRGHQVRLAAPRQSRIYEEALKRGLPVCAVPMERKTIAGYRALRSFLVAESAEIVNTHSSTDSWLSALACVGLRNAPSLVRTRHISAPIPSNFGTRWLYRSAAARIVTTGEALRLQVIRETGANPDRVVSIPTGIDLSQFRPDDRLASRAALGLAAEDFLVGIVATLRSWKGHRYLLDSVATIADPHLKVVIVGAGPGEANLRRQTQDLGIADRVIMAGQRENVVPWLQSFDTFVLPSYANEGVPQAIMQAMACGLPIITTNVGAIGEIARDGVTAMMVRPQDADALAAAIVRLRDDATLCGRLGRAAIVEAQARFSEDIMLERMEEIFRDAMKKDKPTIAAIAK